MKTETAANSMELVKKSLFCVDESTREKGVKFLHFYKEMGYTKALKAADVSWVEINACMKASETFRKVVREMRNAHDQHSAQKIIEIMENKAAAGDVKAAGLILPAYDARFRQNAPQTAQAVNIQINL